MNILSYKGYIAKIEIDAEDNILFGNLVGIRDTVGFHGESVSELTAAFHEAVEFYLESCEKAGREPERPFSGKMQLTLDAQLHEEIATAAAREGKSLNNWVVDTLAQVVHHQ